MGFVDNGQDIRPNPEIKFTNKQKECIDFDSNHDLLVQGIAGSGKSLVLVYRALGTFAKEYMEGRQPTIAILTFANSLKNYTQEVIDQYPDIVHHITVDTVDSLMARLYFKVFHRGRNIRLSYYGKEDALKSILEEVTKNKDKETPNRFLKTNMRDFLSDELRWIKQRSNHLQQFDDYAKATRYGRGTAIRPTQKDRAVIWDIYERYYDEVRRKGYYESEDAFAEMADKLDMVPDSMKFDYVFVDECQDLGLTKLRVAKGIARKSITLAADLAQMIYHVGFSWAEIGINIKGQASKKLYGTFRNTKQIMMLSDSVKQKNHALTEDMRVTEVPDREGPKPQLYYVESEMEEYSHIAEIIKAERQKNTGFTIAVIVRSKRDLEKIEKGLRSRGITDYQKFRDPDFKMLKPGVKLITYHSSKGLEFDEVLLPFLDEGILPYIPKHADEDQAANIMDESRSLLYVGMTRAKFMLFMFSKVDKASPLISDFDKRYYTIG